MSQPGYSGNQRIVDIPADSGAFLAILAQSPVRRVVIQESTITAEGAQNTLQGLLQYQIPNDGTENGFTTVFQAVGANDETSQGQVKPASIMLGNPISQHEAFGELIGNGPNVIVGIGVTPATTLCKLRSGTATATSVLITEYN